MTAILFIHGFPFDHTMWRRQVVALPRWQSIAPDLAGVGETPGPASSDEYSVALYAADLVAMLDRLKVEQTVICGLSMGGYIAFELLRRHARRVRGAILCNTKAAADTPEAKQDRDAMTVLAKQSGSSAIAERLLPKLLARATFERRPEIVSEVRGMMTRASVPGIIGALHALRERPDSTPLLKTIGVPVLVIAGEEDQIAPAAGMREMAGTIPGARFVVISEAGHVAPLEQPDAVNTAIGEFLRNLD